MLMEHKTCVVCLLLSNFNFDVNVHFAVAAAVIRYLQWFVICNNFEASNNVVVGATIKR